MEGKESDLPKNEPIPPRHVNRLLRAIALQAFLFLATLAAIELFLRISDFRVTRLYPEEVRLPYQFDSELGWFPIPNMVRHWRGTHSLPMTELRHNSIGLRDIELVKSVRPIVLFIGDSFVYGLGVEEQERFTEQLRRQWPDITVINAGVAGYGTDQELLLLKRLWSRIQPQMVVLIVCVENDHHDNSTNLATSWYKPFLAEVDGQWEFHGLPVPKGRAYYFYDNWIARSSALVRLASYAYTPVRYPRLTVPDPTNQLVAMMRDFVEARGASFLVGLQFKDNVLEPFLKFEMIPYTRFDGAEIIAGDIHWSRQGHAMVAHRLTGFVRENMPGSAKERVATRSSCYCFEATSAAVLHLRCPAASEL